VIVMIIKTGGAVKTDMFFEEIGLKYGCEVIAYSFEGHDTQSKCRENLTNAQLHHAKEFVSQVANKKHKFPTKSEYINNLLCRDYYIVNDVDVVFAFGWINHDGSISGGTYWGVEMAHQALYTQGVRVYFFNLTNCKWNLYVKDTGWMLENNYNWKIYDPFKEVDFSKIKTMAGIGTRDTRGHDFLIRNEIEKLIVKWVESHGKSKIQTII